MTIIFVIKDLDTDFVYIFIYRLNTDREYLEEIDSEEEVSDPMDMDNYYSDQEYWFEGDE